MIVTMLHVASDAFLWACMTAVPCFAGTGNKAAAIMTNPDAEYGLDDDELLALAATQLDES